MLLIVFLLLSALPPRPFGEERLLLDRRLAGLARTLPEGPTAQADVAQARDLLLAAGLTSVDAVARPPKEAGSTGEVLVDVTGLGLYLEIDRFFRQALFSPRLIDVASVNLTATPDDRVRLQAVVCFPYRPARAALPPAPEDLRDKLQGVPRATADQFLRDQALAFAKTDTIASLRRARRNPRLFLAELAAIVRERPVALTFASLEDEFVVRGLAAGFGPARGLERRFERGFFRMSQFLVAKEGACHRFEARGRAPIAGPDADLPLPAEDAFRQDDAPCKVDRDTGSLGLARTPQKDKPGSGLWTLRLRDLDAVDVFDALSRVTGQSFIVDGDVVGRISTELNKVSLDEALAALSRQGLSISGPGVLRRVSLARNSSALPTLSGAGAPSSFSLKRAMVRDVLAVMTDADEKLAALGPEGPLGKLSLFAREVPLLDIRSAVLATAGLTEKIEENRRVLMRGNEESPVVPIAAAGSEPRLVATSQDLSVHELELAGLGGSEDTWLAFAYSPSGSLFAYRAGDVLSDGGVRAVESTDALIDTEDGPMRLRLLPMR